MQKTAFSFGRAPVKEELDDVPSFSFGRPDKDVQVPEVVSTPSFGFGCAPEDAHPNKKKTLSKTNKVTIPPFHGSPVNVHPNMKNVATQNIDKAPSVSVGHSSEVVSAEKNVIKVCEMKIRLTLDQLRQDPHCDEQLKLGIVNRCEQFIKHHGDMITEKGVDRLIGTLGEFLTHSSSVPEYDFIRMITEVMALFRINLTPNQFRWNIAQEFAEAVNKHMRTFDVLNAENLILCREFAENLAPEFRQRQLSDSWHTIHSF